MDSDDSAQDVTRCDLCKHAIAQSYCDFCYVNLCKPCIGEHITDEYDKHKIVTFELRKSTLIYPKCETHQTESCNYQCNDCNIFVCLRCMASEQHRAHRYESLQGLFVSKKENVQKDTEELENQILPIYKEIAIDLKNQIDNLDDEYVKLATEISTHRDDLHRKIDTFSSQMQKELNEIKLNHQGILKEILDEIIQLQSRIQQSLHSLTDIWESNDVCKTIFYSSENTEFKKLPSKIKLTMPKFIAKQNERENMESFFGELTPLSSTLEERIFKAEEPNISLRELMDEPQVLNTIRTGHDHLRSITCLDEDIWTSGCTADIKCFDIQGVLQKTIKTKSENWPYDIAVDRDGALLYSDGKTRRVIKVKNEQSLDIIKLQEWNPVQMCFTSTGDLLVGMFSDDQTQFKVVRYSGSTEKQHIQFDEEGQSLYSGNSKIKYISENRNQDICVADKGAGALVVVNQTGTLRFRYTGHFSPTKNKRFEPYGIATDSQSHILTADYNNHCIHLLDPNGQYLRNIDDFDRHNHFGLCVDNNDNLFVCEINSKTVRKIKYMK